MTLPPPDAQPAYPFPDPQPGPDAPEPYRWRPVAVLTGALIVLGVVLGLVWTAWSPDGPVGILLPAGTQADETEAFIGADGRFALLTSVVGVLAGVAAWYLRRQRGPLVALALAVGGVGGALLTNLTGHLVRGEGAIYTCGSQDQPLRCSEHLPLWVQMHGLLFLEGALAVLVYSLFVAFAVSDDLGRPDPAQLGRSVAFSTPGATATDRV